jgi:hypothetical protein
VNRLLTLSVLAVSVVSLNAETFKSLNVQDLFGNTNNALAADKAGHIYGTNVSGETFVWTANHNANGNELTDLYAIVDDSGTRQIILDFSGVMYLDGGDPGSFGQVDYGDILAPISILSQLWANDPIDPVYGVVNRRYADAHYGGGSQTPWTSDIDSAGFKLTDNGGDNYLQLNNSGSVFLRSSDTLTLYSDGSTVEFSGASGVQLNDIPIINGSSSLSLKSDGTFGIHNGEVAGVGADINLASDNGNVNITSSIFLTDSATFGSDTARISVNNAFTLQGVTFAQAAYFAQNMFYDGSMHADMPIDDTLTSSRFLMINLSGYVDDPNGGAFNWQTWTSGAGPITWTSLMQLTPDGVLRLGQNTDHGEAGGDVSITGSYWSGGSEGFTGTLAAAIAAGKNVVGGIISN